jgi:hypothetical protein
MSQDEATARHAVNNLRVSARASRRPGDRRSARVYASVSVELASSVGGRVSEGMIVDVIEPDQNR